MSSFRLTKDRRMSKTSSRLHSHAQVMVQQLMIEHKAHEPRGYGRLIEQRMNPYHLLLCRIAPQTNRALGSTHSPVLPPGHSDGHDLPERTTRFTLEERLQIMGPPPRSKAKRSPSPGLGRGKSVDQFTHGGAPSVSTKDKPHDDIERLIPLFEDSSRHTDLQSTALTPHAHEPNPVVRNHDVHGRLGLK